MQTINQHLTNALVTALAQLKIESDGVPTDELALRQLIALDHPSLEEHGDYSTAIALKLAAHLGQSPLEIAQQIVDHLPTMTQVAKVEVIKPGFINLHLKVTVFQEQIVKIIQAGEDYGTNHLGKGKTLVIDYSAPNIAKRFSVGHLRSTIIGQAIYNMYQFAGWQVVGDNHLGDWGTQFGKMIVAIRLWADKPIAKLSVGELEELYVKFHTEAEADPTLEDQARAAFFALEQGNQQELAIWQEIVDTSLKEFDQIYDLMQVKIDHAYGESFYQDQMQAVIDEALAKGVAKESQGAIVIDLDEEKLPPALIQKSDGATLYMTRDLATLKFRKSEWNPDLIIYEVGSDQKLHFKQLFAAAVKLGWYQPEQLVHVAHGMVRLAQGKMSTRKGITVKLGDVLSEAVKRAGEFNQDETVAKAVAVGAVKYNDLKRSPESAYTFDWDEMLSLKGNSGPYLQYTYARCQSVLEKAGFAAAKVPKVAVGKGNESLITDEEATLLKWLVRFPEFVSEATTSFLPSALCAYLHNLALRFNVFYHEQPILKANSNVKEWRLMYTQATAQVLQIGLKLLGIEPLARM